MSLQSGQPRADTGTGTLEAPGPRVFSEWCFSEGKLDLSTPAVMGIMNFTPDSFFDGGELASVEMALKRGRLLLMEGAWILDVGGESTRPGADPVSVKEELERVLPFIRQASKAGLGPLSINTRRAAVAREGLRSGARIVSGLAEYGDVAEEVTQELGASLQVLGCPIMVGPSRKSFIGEVTEFPPTERLPGTLAACVLAFSWGARIFRVHDVAPIVQGLSVTQAIFGAWPRDGVRSRTGSRAPQDRAQES